MEQSNVAGEVQDTATKEASAENNATESVEERLAKMESYVKTLEKSNSRLLKESKEHKDKHQSVLSEMEKKVSDEAVKKGDDKKLVELLQGKLKVQEEKLNRLASKNIEKTLKFELTKHASDAQDIELLKKALPMDMISGSEADDDYEITGVKEAIDKLRTDMPYLFKAKNVPAMASGKPNPQTAGGAKPLTDLPASELAALLMKLNK